MDEQEEEITTTRTGQKAGITQAEMQEETLQPESLETQDTGMKQVDSTQGQDSESVQAQNMEENKVPDAKDTSDMQVQDNDTDSQANDEQPNSIYLMIGHQEHCRKTIIKLLLMMMSRTTQHNLVIQSPNRSCHEASEYPLQR